MNYYDRLTDLFIEQRLQEIAIPQKPKKPFLVKVPPTPPDIISKEDIARILQSNPPLGRKHDGTIVKRLEAPPGWGPASARTKVSAKSLGPAKLGATRKLPK